MLRLAKIRVLLHRIGITSAIRDVSKRIKPSVELHQTMSRNVLESQRFRGIIQDVDLRHLRVFMAVCERGSFSRAGVDLNISRSTVSIHISNLENRLGMTLCERRRGQFRLTAQGKIVFHATRELIAELERFRNQVNAAHEKLAGELRVGYLDQLTSHPDFPLVNALRIFGKIAPKVRLTLRVASMDEIEKRVEDGTLDLGVVADYNILPQLEYRDFFVEQQQLYCGAGHYLFSLPEEEIDRTRIAGFDLAISGYVNPRNFSLGGVNWKVGTIAYSAEALAHLVLSGNYLALLPVHYAERWVSQGAMRALLPKTFTIGRPMKLITKSGRGSERVLNRFVHLLTSE